MADSDSENEGILNNIQRLVIRPPGHTGKAKKGHICFDGGFETMNLGRVDFITIFVDIEDVLILDSRDYLARLLW